MTEDIYIREYNGKKNLIGSIKGKVFQKRIKGSKHKFKTTNSFGFDAEVWNDIIKLECEEVKVYDEETGTLYCGRVSHLDLVKDYKHFKPHRAQVFIPIKHFKT